MNYRFAVTDTRQRGYGEAGYEVKGGKLCDLD